MEKIEKETIDCFKEKIKEQFIEKLDEIIDKCPNKENRWAVVVFETPKKTKITVAIEINKKEVID